MVRAKVTSKGQITLPIEIRHVLGVKKGNFVEFFNDHKKIVLKKAEGEVSTFEQWIGYAKHKNLDDVDEFLTDLRGRDE